MSRTIGSVVVLGANGAMGSGAGAVFAAAGVPTVLLARTLAKAEAGRDRAVQLGKGTVEPGRIECGTYDDLARVAGSADLVLEAVSEDLAVKHAILARVEQARGPSTIVASVSSGLSIAQMCAPLGESTRRHFLGIHLFNPPTVIVGCELIAHAGTDPGVVAVVRDFLTNVVKRELVETRDTPAFAGNRLGFRVLNEVAQLAETHGVAYMDQLVGTHTGRALPPLATIDLVGWDVHKAIVDNLHASTHDVARDFFKLPAYMQRGIDAGVLGRKTRRGFFRLEGKKPDVRQLELDPASGDYRALPQIPTTIPIVEKMRAALRGGGYTAAMDTLCVATDRDAVLLRRILLGYISYGLGLVGEVVERARDIDRIMGFGFAWAPPGMLVDAIGPGRTIILLDRAQLPVPQVVLEAATHQRPLFDEPRVDRTRFFPIAA